jgi:hypothetical protein
MVETNRFLLIAWLHFLFLGLFVPFIWIELKHKIHSGIWMLYVVSFLLSELALVFPESVYSITNTSIMTILFITYFCVFLSVSVVHLTYLFKSK